MRLIAIALACMATAVAADQVDLGVVYRIKTEAFDHSKVMEHLQYLSDVYGPRLTASPEFAEAADWTVQRLRDYGLENVHTEKWGPFGRGWSLQKFSVEMIRPRYSLLAAWPLAWSGPTSGPVRGEPILAPAPRNDRQQSEADLDRYIEKYKGKLRGKVVLISRPRWNWRSTFRRSRRKMPSLTTWLAKFRAARRKTKSLCWARISTPGTAGQARPTTGPEAQ